MLKPMLSDLVHVIPWYCRVYHMCVPHTHVYVDVDLDMYVHVYVCAYVCVYHNLWINKPTERKQIEIGAFGRSFNLLLHN
jgi:hypothetical protein